MAAKGSAGRLADVAGVTEVQNFDGYANLTATLRQAPTDAAYVDDAARLVADLARAIQGGASDAPAELVSLNVVIFAPVTTRLGDDDTAKILNLSYDGADLRMVKVDKLTPARLLGLAHEVRVPSQPGAQAVMKWCDKGDNRRDAPALCDEAS